MDNKRLKIFGELPEALVDDILAKTEQVSGKLQESFSFLKDECKKIKKQIEDAGIIRHESNLTLNRIPTSCGIDGSCTTKKLAVADLVAAASVAVEGLKPPSHQGYWEKPHHRLYIEYRQHHPSTGILIRGLMTMMEIEMSAIVPHEMVLIDGSLLTPVIHFDKCISALQSLPEDDPLKREIIVNTKSFLTAYSKILESASTEKIWVGLPKRTSKRELGKRFGWSPYYDDRVILMSILSAGQFTQPCPIEKEPASIDFKIPSYDEETNELKNRILTAIDNIFVMYYKPYDWSGVFRLEIAGSIINDVNKIAALLYGIKSQCLTPAIMEPYPQFIAHKMVYRLSCAVSVFNQVSISKLASSSSNLSEVFSYMRGYRTDYQWEKYDQQDMS